MYFRGTNFRVKKLSRFSRILVKFAKVNSAKNSKTLNSRKFIPAKIFFLDLFFNFEILFCRPTFEVNFCHFYCSSVVKNNFQQSLLQKIIKILDKSKDKSVKTRKFFLAKYFERLDSRKLILAKCKNFANWPIRESFFRESLYP